MALLRVRHAVRFKFGLVLGLGLELESGLESILGYGYG